MFTFCHEIDQKVLLREGAMIFFSWNYEHFISIVTLSIKIRGNSRCRRTNAISNQTFNKFKSSFSKSIFEHLLELHSNQNWFRCSCITYTGSICVVTLCHKQNYKIWNMKLFHFINCKTWTHFMLINFDKTEIIFKIEHFNFMTSALFLNCKKFLPS